MSYFDKAILEVLEHEGLLSDDKADRGGLTKYGISQKAYPNIDIASLTLDEAIAIYRRDYWRPVYDLFADYRVAAKTFDMSVNMGHKRSHKLLQRALELVEDGIIGPQTINAANSENGSVVLDAICKAQKAFYDMLVTSDPSQKKFINGWTRRASWVPTDGTATRTA